MKAKLVACPQCGTGIEWNPANRYRPFCSERCKMIDLGAWATERYRVPVTETDDPEVPDENPEDDRPRPN
jgi:endogenous inhibitor of DNA gyrase (YacG/DUF329 family)